MTTPIVDFVAAYAAAGTTRLHMPGHKGCGPLGCEALDITEIKGADELYGAEGILAQSEANATALFGTEHTYYSTEGSSQCIRAMLALAMRAAPAGGRPLLVAARNAHKALLYAAALLDFDIQWLWPAPEQMGALCSCPIRPDALAQALAKARQTGRKPFGVYVTSPDYLGGVQDIAGLAAVCAEYAVPLLVDNAHGAYLHFLPGGSRHPIALGAAMCCDSGHKTLPVLTGGAYLHIGPGAPVREETEVRNALALFGSTSPSYLILQSLDHCNRVLAESFRPGLESCCKSLSALCRELNALAAARGAACPLVLAVDGADREPIKLTLDAAALGISGEALAEELRTDAIECEYADPRYVVLMFAPANPQKDYRRIKAALVRLCTERLPCVQTVPSMDAGDGFLALEQELAARGPRRTIREAAFSRQVIVPAGKALGKICAIPTVSCPPAIPLVVSGEAIGPAAIALMERYGIRQVAVCAE